MPHPCQPPSSHFRPGSSPRHPELAPCHPKPSPCHPDPSSCHPEPPSCHPERSEGSAVFLARGRARLLPSLFAAREKGSAGTSPSLAKLPGTPGPSKNSDDSLRADCFVRRGGLVMTPQRKQSLRAKRSNPASSSVLESCHTGSCSSLRAKRSNLIALNGDSLSWATR